MSDTPRYQTLNDWLAWMETLHPREIDLGLERVTRVASRLGIIRQCSTGWRAVNLTGDIEPQVVTIAGTNGKGSCVAALEALLLQAGSKVGCYTSPHILHYSERIRLNGLCAESGVICDLFDEIDRAREEISLTYFEFATLAAMLGFSRAGLQYWILEVGLGGRLDAVNMVDADVAVITSVAMDHENWLGNTLGKIGREKAGIMRADHPVVLASGMPDSVYCHAAEIGARQFVVGEQFEYQVSGNELELRLDQPVAHAYKLTLPSLPLPSVAAAVQVAALLGRAPDQNALQQAFSGLQLAGRFEQVRVAGLSLVLDVAHNPAAMQLLGERLASLKTSLHSPPCHCIVAMMADKKVNESLAALSVPVDHWWPVGLPGNERALKADQLADCLPGASGAENGLNAFQNVSLEKDVASALDALTAKASEFAVQPLVLVTGSFFTVSAARQWLNNQNQLQAG